MVGTGMRRAGTSIGGLLAGTLASATLAGVLALHVRAVLSDHVGAVADRLRDRARRGRRRCSRRRLAGGRGAAGGRVRRRPRRGRELAGRRAAGPPVRAAGRAQGPRARRRGRDRARHGDRRIGSRAGARGDASRPSTAAVPDDLGWAVTTRATTQTTTAEHRGESTPTPQARRRSPTLGDHPVDRRRRRRAGTATERAALAPTAPAEVPHRGDDRRDGLRHATTAPAPHERRGHDVVVAAGDSLWSIAARHLPPSATDAQVAAAWPRWYEANSVGDRCGSRRDPARSGAHGARDGRGAGAVSADRRSRRARPRQDPRRGRLRPGARGRSTGPRRSDRPDPPGPGGARPRRPQVRLVPAVRRPGRRGGDRARPRGARDGGRSHRGPARQRPVARHGGRRRRSPHTCPTATRRRSPGRSRWPRWRCWPADAPSRSSPAG